MATQFTTFLESRLSPIPGIYNVLRPLDLRARKILLSICRCQSTPTSNSKINKHVIRTFPEYRANTIVTPSGDVLSLSTIVDGLQSYITNPITNGFLQMVIKAIALEDEDVERAIEETYAKEIVASQERRYTPTIDLTPILMNNPTRRHYPLLRNWTYYNPSIHQYIFHSLKSAIPILSRQHYFPNYGSKLLPETSSKQFQELQSHLGFNFERSTLGVEKVYSRSGESSEGPTEMKHAFAYNDLRPRVYFSRGATHYCHSKYIQEIFNRIISVFPSIHKFERFHISKLELNNGEIFMIYDYSTFTTNLQSLSEFLLGLSEFYKGVEITVIDTFQGPTIIDLGEYLLQYTVNCNSLPEFETFFGSTDGEPITYQSGAGLLGIPGNITSSTLWHGIILMVLIQSILAKIVGDDAGGVLPDGDKPEVLVNGLKEFGDVSMPKTESWPYVDIMANIERHIWQYVKRQIYRLENKIHVGGNPMNFPTPALFLENYSDRFHSTQPIEDIVKTSIKCADRFVRECQKFVLKDQDEEVIEFCRRYHRFILRPVIKDDIARQEGGQPRLIFHRDIVESTFEEWFRHLPDIVTIPEFALEEEHPEQFVTHRFYRRQMRKDWKLIVDLEYGSCRMMMRKIKASENVDMLRKFFEGDYNTLYSFVIFDCCPMWLLEYVNSRITTPIVDYEPIDTLLPDDCDRLVDLDDIF